MLCYFAGDLDGADAAVQAARTMALAPGAPNRLLDVITLQGMIAHNRGEWFDRLRRELRATSENPQLAAAVFDSHLCVAEYLLYGPTPYEEVLALTRQLREQAERAGARRGVAFAVTVAGEAALLAGDLDAARADLVEALALHAEMAADTGTAHTLSGWPRSSWPPVTAPRPSGCCGVRFRSLAGRRWLAISCSASTGR